MTTASPRTTFVARAAFWVATLERPQRRADVPSSCTDSPRIAHEVDAAVVISWRLPRKPCWPGAGVGRAAGLVRRRAGWQIRIFEGAGTSRKIGFALRDVVHLARPMPAFVGHLRTLDAGAGTPSFA